MSKYQIQRSSPRGGKAGRGFNKSGTVQVIEPIGNGRYLLVAQFRYSTGNNDQILKAMSKAQLWVSSHTDPKSGVVEDC
jgi:hypothetical protein